MYTINTNSLLIYNFLSEILKKKTKERAKEKEKLDRVARMQNG